MSDTDTTGFNTTQFSKNVRDSPKWPDPMFLRYQNIKQDPDTKLTREMISTGEFPEKVVELFENGLMVDPLMAKFMAGDEISEETINGLNRDDPVTLLKLLSRIVKKRNGNVDEKEND